MTIRDDIIIKIKIAHALNHFTSEMSEVIKINTKIHTYGLDGVNPVTNKTNKEEINLEIADVLGVLQILYELGVSQHSIIPTAEVISSYRKKMDVIDDSVQKEIKAMFFSNGDDNSLIHGPVHQEKKSSTDIIRAKWQYHAKQVGITNFDLDPETGKYVDEATEQNWRIHVNSLSDTYTK